VAVSHAYAHLIEFGEPVEIGGLKIKSGDLIHGDCHGVLTIPPEIVSEIPQEVGRIVSSERELIQFCRSPQFSLKGLSDRLEQTSEDCL
jgi:4-hydroxy-4-methyl-2-oxoglutarate aldolase